MNRSTGLWLLGVGALAMTSSVSAMDLTFTPRISLGMQKYKLKWEGFRSDTGEKLGDVLKVDEYVPTLTLGGTLSMGRLYLDAYWQQTDTTGQTASVFERPDRATVRCIDTAQTLCGNSYFRYFDSDKAEHKDYALSLGYGFENGLTVFGGYKYGKADVTGTVRSVTHYTDINGSPTNVDIDPSAGLTREKASFEADGPFLGVGYVYPIGPGALSISGAWAWLDGKTKQRDEFGTQIESKPSADGLSLSVAWKAPITDQLSYGISIDSYSYNYKKKKSLFDDGSLSIPLKVKEESVGVRASLAYRF
jgi:hypothetical protein